MASSTGADAVTSVTSARRRSSFGGLMSKSGEDAVAGPEHPKEANDDAQPAIVGNASSEVAVEAKRRRSRNSIQMTMCSGLDGSVLDNFTSEYALSKGISNDSSSKEKMDMLLILAKERGATAEKIFAYFDLDGDGEISPAEFKTALTKLDKNWKLEDSDIDEVVKLFDENGDGAVDVPEFQEYCYNLPCLAWKAEKLRHPKREPNPEVVAPAVAGAEKAPTPRKVRRGSEGGSRGSSPNLRKTPREGAGAKKTPRDLQPKKTPRSARSGASSPVLGGSLVPLRRRSIGAPAASMGSPPQKHAAPVLHRQSSDTTLTKSAAVSSTVAESSSVPMLPAVKTAPPRPGDKKAAPAAAANSSPSPATLFPAKKGTTPTLAKNPIVGSKKSMAPDSPANMIPNLNIAPAA